MPAVTDSCTFTLDEIDVVNGSIGAMIRTPLRKIARIPDLEWWVECFPAGYDDELFGHVGFLLNFSRPVNVKFEASIVGTNFFHVEKVEIDDHTLPSEIFSIDMLEFIKAETLRDIDAVRYGKIEFKFTVELKAPITNPFPALSSEECLLKCGPTVTLSVDSQNVEISKALLTHVSPVFNAMFTPDTKEALTDYVEITDFDYITVQTFVDYCNGRPAAGIPTNLLVELMWFADKYDIQRLTAQMEAYFADNITAENIFKVATYAVTHSRDNLINACLKIYRKIAKNLHAPPEEADVEEFLFAKVFCGVSTI